MTYTVWKITITCDCLINWLFVV